MVFAYRLHNSGNRVIFENVWRMHLMETKLYWGALTGNIPRKGNASIFQRLCLYDSVIIIIKEAIQKFGHEEVMEYVTLKLGFLMDQEEILGMLAIMTSTWFFRFFIPSPLQGIAHNGGRMSFGFLLPSLSINQVLFNDVLVVWDREVDLNLPANVKMASASYLKSTVAGDKATIKCTG